MKTFLFQKMQEKAGSTELVYPPKNSKENRNLQKKEEREAISFKLL